MQPPRKSDICVSIRSVRADGPKPSSADPQGRKTLENALRLLEDVRPDRIEWSYTWRTPDVANALRERCPMFVAAINTISPAGNAVDIEGTPCIAPWMRGFGQPGHRLPYMCMNNPEDVRVRLDQVAEAIAGGFDAAIQHDDWLGNAQMMLWDPPQACFCAHCLAGFGEFLDLDLDYRRYLGVRGIHFNDQLFQQAEQLKALNNQLDKQEPK